MPETATPTTHVSTSGEPCPICAPHTNSPANPEPRQPTQPTPPPKRNSTLTGANRYARAYSEHRADRP
jgi:hypothetical protein